MRGHHALCRAAFALLAALGLLLSVAGCGPDAPEVTSATASPRRMAATPTPAPAPSPAVPPDPLPSPTPTPRIIRDEIDRLGIRTPCFGGIPGTSDAFLRWSRDGSAIVFSRDSDVVWMAPDGSALRQFPVLGPMTAVDVSPDGTQGRLFHLCLSHQARIHIHTVDSTRDRCRRQPDHCHYVGGAESRAPQLRPRARPSPDGWLGAAAADHEHAVRQLPGVVA